MERTYAHIDLDERRKIARWRTAKLSVDVNCGEAWKAPFNHFPRVETQSVCRRSDHGSDRLLLHGRRSEST